MNELIDDRLPMMLSQHSSMTPVAFWDIGGTLLTLYKKPNWFHRNMIKIILGWSYVETTKQQLLYG